MDCPGPVNTWMSQGSPCDNATNIILPTSGSCKEGALWTYQLRGSGRTWQGLCNHNEWTITCSQPSRPPVGPCDDMNTLCNRSGWQAANYLPNVGELKRCLDCVSGPLTIVSDSQCWPNTLTSRGCYNYKPWVV